MKKILIISFALIFISGCAMEKNNIIPSPQPEQQTLDTTAVVAVKESEILNWKKYTYKNLSFKYPDLWEVTSVNQPNGFNIQVTMVGDEGIRTDQLDLNTYNITPKNSKVNTGNVFTLNEDGNSYLKLEINGTTVYADCDHANKGKDTINVCNLIIPTISLTAGSVK